jgi:hypothetical protein
LSNNLASSAICAEEVYGADLVCFAGEVIAQGGDDVSFVLFLMVVVDCKGQQCCIKSSRESLRCGMADENRFEQCLGQIDRGAWTRFFIVALTIESAIILSNLQLHERRYLPLRIIPPRINSCILFARHTMAPPRMHHVLLPITGDLADLAI